MMSSVTMNSGVAELLNDQTNLDIIASYSRGKSVGEIAKEIGRERPYVNDVIESLRDYHLLQFGRWNIDVQALGMTRTLEFRSFTEDSWNAIYENNFFLSYLARVEMVFLSSLSRVKTRETKYLAMYTFPEEEGKVGTEISSWYYNYPNFRTPFFRQDFNKKSFFEQFEEEDNSNPLVPRGEKIENPSIIDFLICRYVQLEEGDIDFEKCTKEIKEIAGKYIDVSEDEAEARFEDLKNKNVIYPIIPLDFSRISYDRIYSIMSRKEIFRLMKTSNKFNIITGISLMEEKKAFILIQFPHTFQDTVAAILDQLDEENEMYVVASIYENRSIPYKYYLEKLAFSRRKK